MIAKSLLIGFIAFDGATLINGAFPAQDPAAGPVYGNRNFSGWKAGVGSYCLRIGGPSLIGSSNPLQVPNEWSRSFGNQRTIVTIDNGGVFDPVSYNLTRLDDNTWNLDTYSSPGPAFLPVATDLWIQFSVETLIT